MLAKLKHATDKMIKQSITRSANIVEEVFKKDIKYVEPKDKLEIILEVAEMIRESEEEMNNRLSKALGKHDSKSK